MNFLAIGKNCISGQIPPQWGKLSSNLLSLDLSDNIISGTIPLAFFELNNLEELYLAHNKIGGTISPRISKLSSLKLLLLSNNDLSGTIPSELGQLSNMEKLFFLRFFVVILSIKYRKVKFTKK